MRHLDLFSGIGGFALAARWVGMQTVGFCEIKDYPRLVLAKNFPGIPIHNDIRTLEGDEFGTIDIISGGFPCQDISIAGTRVGFKGVRSSLYREMLRIVGECRPQYAVFENVANLLNGEQGRWFAQFLYDLASIGYDAEWHSIPASCLGANHHRQRIWVIAYPTGDREQKSIFTGISKKLFRKGKFGRKTRGPAPRTHWETPQPRICEMDDGLPGWVGSVSGYGNAIVPQVAYEIFKVIMKRARDKFE